MASTKAIEVVDDFNVYHDQPRIAPLGELASLEDPVTPAASSLCDDPPLATVAGPSVRRREACPCTFSVSDETLQERHSTLIVADTAENSKSATALSSSTTIHSASIMFPRPPILQLERFQEIKI